MSTTGPHRMLLLIFLFSLAWSQTHCLLQCKGKDGQPVDWFIVYKMPVFLKDSNGQSEKYPHRDYPFPAHFYLDKKTPDWVEVQTPLNETGQALAYTLEQFYQNQTELGYVLYNDQTLSEGANKECNSQDESYGHSKGTVLFDGTTGLWLIHSTPCFPLVKRSKYGFPHNGIHYGQHFLCISVTSQDINNIGYQLRMNHPYVFESYLPASMDGQYANISMLLKKDTSDLHGSFHVLPMSIGGDNSQALMSFAKSGQFGKDLYDHLVAPALGDSLDVETWQHGAKYNLNATCNGPYKVLDIERVQMNANNGFHNLEDHSKYAVAASKEWACVGDINRQTSQEKRGGGTMCLKNAAITKAYRKIIRLTNNCQN